MSSARQSEILFLYDVKLANQNGDRMAENQPRFDESDNKAIVSDVRIKRTIRDYMLNQKGFNKPSGEEKESYNKYIFVSNETIQLASDRAKELGVQEAAKIDGNKEAKEKIKTANEQKQLSNWDAVKKCIDIRLFGAVVPKPKMEIIGSVQFSWSKSLNPTIIMPNPITGGFGSEGNESKTLGMKPAIKYGLFAVYGTINRANAQKLDTTEEDIVEMIDALWHGTNFLKTTSKNQKSRAFIRIVYKENSNYYIGLLDELVSIQPKEEIDLMDISDVNSYNGIDFSRLDEKLGHIKEHIQEIQIIIDEDILSIDEEGKRQSIENIFTNLLESKEQEKITLTVVTPFNIQSLTKGQESNE
ncbi:type I-B CRISPR-associated protein Cas7/Csh2 [Sulfurovum mangrovi]|uniref:type I-B CRISPR-associated protein Cas7/Csh2 n=1 Tax=Sulfurovum mangrovi TaxID=2893889 RepID=UPI001E461FBA|nr:type I-B CRISPR-associated protein Cas7/Csh2 [Sulfurovum mangrovi]UFH60008.1 type I-B CRISPR-associated protein Cas7/Csh2 [Sulfurovum mangrovi]